MISDRSLVNIEIDETDRLRMQLPSGLFPGPQFQSRLETCAVRPLRTSGASSPESVPCPATWS